MLNAVVGLAAVINFTLSVIILLRGSERLLSRIFAVFAAAVGFWCFAAFFFWVSDEPLLWGRLMFVGPIIMAPAFLAFALVLSGPTKKLNLSHLGLSCLPAVIFLILVPTDIIVREIIYPQKEVVYGIGNSLFGVYFGLCFLAAFFSLGINWKKARGRRRLQFRYLFLGIFLSSIIGVTTNLILPLMGTSLYNRIGPAGTVFFVGIVAYAILKHQLMDIAVIIRRTLIFAGLFGVIMAAIGIVSALTQSFMGHFLGMGDTARQLLSIFIAIFLFDPTRTLLTNLTDKFLFQKKYDYHKLLKDASRGMSNIESLEHLLGLVMHFITMKMRVKNAAVLMREGMSDQYHLIYQRGFDKKFLTLTLYQNDPLIHYLETHKEAVDIERIKEQVEAASYQRDKSEKAYDYEAIRERMNQLQANCCVPSFLGRELRNVLMLGEKKSGEYYSNEDLNLLYTLAQESSIAIENARLYDEALRKSHELEHINEQLEHSKTLLMKALQEAEGANKQLQDTQAQLIHEQKMATLGRLAASVGHEVNNPLTILSMNVSRVILKYRKNQDMKVTEILDVFDKMEKNIERIKAVVNTLTGLLKKSEKGKFEPLSLKLILEETLPLVQFQTYLDNLSGTEVDFNVPGNVPLIRGDLERLQEVFLNLFINAYHAMAGKRHRKIGVLAEIDPRDPNMVAIHFRDNGSGMTEEVAKKIFNYGFTTKPPGKGSGLGLYMCKYIIELHGGTITVDSKLGEGTTFTLTLPIYSETPALKSVSPASHAS